MLKLHTYVVPVSMYNAYTGVLPFASNVQCTMQTCDTTFEGLCTLVDLGIYLKTDLYGLVYLHLCNVIWKCLYVSVCN